jgi:Cytochrome c554 and c-prime
MRTAGFNFVVLQVVLLLTLGYLLAADETHPLAAAKYMGPGSCAAPSCHGGVQPRTETSVLQNEYSTWVVKDKFHTKAFNVLTNDIGQRMGRILGLAHPETEQKCLVCHSLDATPEQSAKTFDKNDGVSCENCHGPASNWLEQHTRRDWNYEKSVELGMYNTRDLIQRSEKCLSCHLGTAEKFVDHAMIAAGHPDLYFELESFSAYMPRHWKEPVDKDPWVGVRTVGTGQAVQLREELRRVARRAQGKVWPEYAELDCFACHHSLTAAKDSWRQQRGYPDRRPGNPPFNMSRYVVFQKVTYEIDRNAGQQLDAEMSQVYKLVSDIAADRHQVATVANRAAQTADRLAHSIQGAQFDREMTLRLMKSISGDAERISNQGERSAEQAVMAT